MAKGDVVLIRASRTQPGVRRVWDSAPDRPFVCLEEYWMRWERNQIEPVCGQLSRDQLFLFDPILFTALEEAYAARVVGDPASAARLETLWAQAKPY